VLLVAHLLLLSRCWLVGLPEHALPLCHLLLHILLLLQQHQQHLLHLLLHHQQQWLDSLLHLHCQLGL
jgi:hypothetical protein